LAFWRNVQQNALQKPEFLNIMPSFRQSSAGCTRVDVFVQQLNFRRTIRLLESPAARRPSGTAAILRKRAIWPAKQQPFAPYWCPQAGALNLEAEAKGVVL
jgi:hypothetical protein